MSVLFSTMNIPQRPCLRLLCSTARVRRSQHPPLPTPAAFLAVTSVTLPAQRTVRNISEERECLSKRSKIIEWRIYYVRKGIVEGMDWWLRLVGQWELVALESGSRAPWHATERAAASLWVSS